MPIVAGDIKWKLSVTTGPGNTNAQADPNLSLGEFMSSTAWAGGVVHDLFDAVSGAENAASDVEYRCVFIHNDHATLSLTLTKVWITAAVASGADVAIGLDPAGAKAEDSATAQAAEIVAEGNAPAGVSFSAPATYAGGLSIGTLPAGQCYGVWVRRTCANTGAVANDGATLNVQGDTEA